MLFFIVAATVTVTTFLMLTAWKKLKRRRRIRFRTPSHKQNGWYRNHSESDGGKIPLMTLNHFQDDDDDEDIGDNEDDGLEDEVAINGAVNGGRHSSARHSFT